jgi:modulator of FtsH protease HflK
MPRSSQSGGPWGSGSKPSDLDEFLRLSQDKLGSLLPGNLGDRGITLIALAAIALWGFSGFFRVEPDELGVVMRFGKFQREAPPGLNYHLPYPIETALTPQALRINKIDIGFNLLRDSTMRDVPAESLMLTGDENIVDVDFFRYRSGSFATRAAIRRTLPRAASFEVCLVDVTLIF